MNFPCPVRTDCPCDDGPLANFTAEAPDRNIFFPRIPYGFPSPAANALEPWSGFYPGCASAVSQDDADLCAAVGPWPGDGLPTVYGSGEVTCTVPCEDSTTQTFTLPHNFFFALSQAEADAMAASFVCVVAQLACTGEVPPVFYNEVQTCSQDCNGETYSYTLQAGIFAAPDQATANLLGYLFACAAVASVCDGTQPPGVLGNQPRFWNTQQNCSVTCTNGSLFTYTVPPNRFVGFTRDEANIAASTYACRKARELVQCIPNVPTFACTGETYYANLAVSGGSVYAVTGGALPTGLTFSGTEITGTPILGGAYTFVVSILLTNGQTVARTYEVQIAQIVTTTLPDATVGAAYSQTITVLGYTSPVFVVVSGALPDGLTLDPVTGIIAGTPTNGTDAAFTVEVSDADGSCLQSYSIVVNAPTINPIEWWKMDEADAVDPVGEVAGTVLQKLSGSILQVPGLINFAQSYDTPAIVSPQLVSGLDALFACDGGWMEMTAWINTDGGCHLIVGFQGFGEFFYALADIGLGTIQAVMALNTVSIPWVPVGWMFVRIIWDNTTNQVGVQLNNGAVSWSAAGVPPQVTATGFVVLRPRNGTFCWIDEVGIYRQQLTAAEVTTIYNAGAGKTCCPIT
jgi:hypothetical protein